MNCYPIFGEFEDYDWDHNTMINGGQTRIRTLGTRKGTTDFESAPFGHSGTCPHQVEERLIIGHPLRGKRFPDIIVGHLGN